MAGDEQGSGRPLSPHLQVWKWHATMAASIFHRLSGVALYFGTLLIAAWIVALGLSPGEDGATPAMYQAIDTVISSVPGQILLVLWTAAVLFHFANGIRHLVWDGPRIGFSPGIASAVSVFNIAFAGLGALAIWAGATLL
jgi:succinate dehydrogenase / fumarate reductase, cytochrome b subunit